MNSQQDHPIVQRFNAIRWHDSKLMDVSIYETQPTNNEIRMSLKVHGGDRGVNSPATLIFREGTYIKMDVDLDVKSQCSNAIYKARCYISSEWLENMNQRLPLNQFEGYLHFHIKLCPEAGNVDILAKDFDLVVQTP